MPDLHANFAYSTVATAPSPATSGTSLTVASGDGSKFPTVPFNATVWPASSQPTAANAEIVRVTARSTDTLTIARTQEGTSARTIVVGDQIAATITAKTLSDIESNLYLRLTYGVPTGAVAETISRFDNLSYSGSAVLTSGILQLIGIFLQHGEVINSITFCSGGTGATSPTHQIFGLYDNANGSAAGTAWGLLAQTNDDTTTSWPGTTNKTLNLTSPYTVPTDGLYYLGILVTATTPPQLQSLSTTSDVNMRMAPIFAGFSGSGLTALPNPASTPTSNARRVYAYVS